MAKDFFDELEEQSEVKSQIVADYFGAWTTIMMARSRSEKLAYVDLFSGPGRYKDGSKSTPLKVMEEIINNKALSRKMVTIFNDANPDYANTLAEELERLPGYDNLKYKPAIYNTQVGDEIAEMFEKTNLVPTLAFIDPWGYKGLTSRLIKALIKDWGSDCIFFFNYNRINMGITNPLVISHMNSLFGEKRAEILRQKVKLLEPEKRELIILNELSEELSEKRRNYVLPFRFIRPDGKRTSHYLILVSKHVLGYTIMKEIMWRYSSDHNDGVASFSFIPVTIPEQLSLLSLYEPKPLDELGANLCKIFKGQTLTVQAIFDKHHLYTPYVKSNYKEALRRLEREGKIKCHPEKRPIRNGVKTMGDNVLVTFP